MDPTVNEQIPSDQSKSTVATNEDAKQKDIVAPTVDTMEDTKLKSSTVVSTEDTKQQSTGPTNEEMTKQLEQLKQDNLVIKTWGDLQSFMEEKLNKTSGFAAIDLKNQGFIELQDFMTYIKDIQVDQLNTIGEKVFKLINEDGEAGKVTLQQWSDAWLQQSQRQYENDHKIQMITQKIDIYQALQTPVIQGQRLVDNKNSTKYQSMVDTIKNSSSLGDISQMFQSIQHTPHQRLSTGKGLEQSSSNVDLRKDRASSKIMDTNFLKYRTPKKDLNEYESSLGRPSFLMKEEKTSAGLRSPLILTSNLRSPQNMSKFQIKPEISTKVEKQMSLNIESRDRDQVRQVNKTSKRKEDLNCFMSKLGLGKYETPRVTLDLASSLKYPKNAELEKMRLIIQGKETIKDTKKNSNLGDMFGDLNLTATSFRKPKSDLQSKDRGKSLSQESFSLNDQSLKNYTMKLIHQHKFVQNLSTVPLQSPQKSVTFQQHSYLVRNN